MRLLDVRHEQTAVFAAEATGKLTRRPGLAVLTAGPGRDQRGQRDRPGPVQRLAAASSSAAGRRHNRWGTGSLQELDQPPLLAPVTKLRRDRARRRARSPPGSTRRSGWPTSPHRGPVFLDVPMDQFFSRADVELPAPAGPAAAGAGPRRPGGGRRAARASRATRAGARHRRVGRRRRGRRAPPRRDRRRPGHHQRDGPRRAPAAATRCWSPRPAARRSGSADLVVVVGTPLDFRLGYGVVRRQGRRARRRGSCTSPTPPARSRGHADTGRLRRPATSTLGPRRASARRWKGRRGARLRTTGGPPTCRTPSRAAAERDARAARQPTPTRSTRPGSTASWSRGWPTTPWSSATAATSCRFAGKYVEPKRARRLARPRALRLPRRRARLRHRRPAGPARRRRSCCCSATARPASR